MTTSSLSPLPPRITPGGWTALAWCVSTVYSFGVQMRWPGESWELGHDKRRLADPFTMTIHEKTALLVAAVLLFLACRLLIRRPLASMTALVLSALTLTTGPLHAAAVAPEQYLPVCVALCFVTAAGPRRTALLSAAPPLAGLLGYVGTRVADGLAVGTSAEAVVLMMMIVAWVVGNAQRNERLHAAQMRVQMAEQAVTAERLRIARELHDMVAHSIGVVAFQAGAAKRVIDTQPEGARRALGAIEDTSRETLAGLRRMLGALHDAESSAPEQRLAGLEDVDSLVANVRNAGVRVDVQWRGARRPLPPEIDLSAFRIIQESVTNVVKHSGTRACRVSVAYRPDDLSVAIDDRGEGGAVRGSGTGEGAGYGITGMRDRVRLLHGEFAAGPRPGGGYRVTARLPLPEDAR